MSSKLKVVKNSLAAGALMLCAQSWAVPGVTALSGTVQDGSTVSLTGREFGAFGGAIVSWDDFEGHASGTPLNGSPAKIGGDWSTQYNYTGGGARVDSARPHAGSRSAYLDWSIDNNSIRAFGWSNRGPYNRLFISYWRNMTGDYNESENDNHKQFYLFGDSGQFPQLMPLIPGGTTSWGVYNNVGDSSISYSARNNMNSRGWSWDNTSNRYQRWDFWATLNDVNVANGTVKAWVDGVLGIENYAYNSRRVNGQWIDFRLGHMAQGFTSTAKAWFDDVYIATTQARVELCDTATWAACTHREIQIVDPARWTASQVSFQLRRGSFDSLSGKYLYVIDQAGTVNAAGYPVSGGAVVASPPMPPANVSVEVN